MVGTNLRCFFLACAGDGGFLRDQLQLNSREMEEGNINRELVRDNTEPPRGDCESIIHPENPDGDVEVSLRSGGDVLCGCVYALALLQWGQGGPWPPHFCPVLM